MGSRGALPKQKPVVSFAAGVPEPSARLTDEARGEYERVVTICRESGRELQQVDFAILEVYAQSWADYWRNDAALQEEGEVAIALNGYKQINPRCRVREDAFKRLAAAAAKLGFSPADRGRVGGGNKTKTGAANPLDNFG